MSVDDHVSRVVHQIYGAADGAVPWTEALRTLRELLGARMTAVLDQRGPGQPDRLVTAVGLDPDLHVRYQQRYWSCDLYHARSRQALREGQVLPHEAYCQDREILASEYYNDFLRHYGIFRILALVPVHRRGRTIVMTVSRGPSAAPWSSADLALASFLMPHLQRALSIERRLARTRPDVIVGASDRFALTLAEGRVATLLLDGASVASICETLNVRASTVRTHLRHLFQKTQTTRQSELVSRLLRGD